MTAKEMRARIEYLQEVSKQHRAELERMREQVAKIQSTLYAIKTGRKVFFNITFYESHGLIRRYGQTIDGKTRWVLTAKGEQILSASNN